MASEKDRRTHNQQQQMKAMMAMMAIDALCDRLESSVRENKKLRIEDLLAECPESLRTKATHALIVRETEVRIELELKPPFAEMLKRFPAQAELIRKLADGNVAESSTKKTKPAPPQQSASLTSAEMSALERKWSSLADTQAAMREAKELIKARRLTKYQAQEILNGRAKSLSFGAYVVIDKIGQGGMGTVLRGEHREMKRSVAIKVLPHDSNKQSDTRNRFIQEVQAAARLTHQNIVTAYDAGEHEGMQYLVMEYVPGSDLHSYVQEHGPMRVGDAIHCTIEAARGLEYAHQQLVIHRDVKPANFLLANGTAPGSGSVKSNSSIEETVKAPEITRCRVKMLDLGLARIDEVILNPAIQQVVKAPLTLAGNMMGTVDYMSPEQAQNTHGVDARADIYSLGCTLFYLLTGHAPYTGDTLVRRLMAHQNQPIPSLRTERPDVPESLDELFRKMLAKKVENRIATMTDVIAALEDCQLEVVPDSQRGGQIRKPRSKNPVGASISDVASITTPVAEENTDPIGTVRDSSGFSLPIKLVLAGTFVALAAILAVVAFNRFATKPEKTVVADPQQAKANESAVKKLTPSVPDAVPVAPWSDRIAVTSVLESGGFATVKLEFGDVVEVRELSEIPTAAFRVEALTVTHLTEISDDIVARLGGLTKLQHLDLSDSNVTDAAMAFLVKLPALTSLNVRGCPIGVEGMKSIGQMKKMISLSVGDSASPGVGNSITRRATTRQTGAISNAAIAELQALLQLEQLTISSGDVTEPALLELIEYCPNLTTLNAEFITLTDEGLKSFSRLPNLVSLSVIEAGISDGALESLGMIQKLTQLNIQGNGISVDAVHRLQEKLPGCVVYGGEYNPKRNFVRSILQVEGSVEVAISGENRRIIEKKSFIDLPEEFTIQKVDFHNVRPLPPDLLQLPEVTELILTDSAVSKYELRQLPARAPSVTILNLSGTSVTDAEIQVLASMSSLQQIDLSRTAVTATGIAALKAALPQCEIIH